MKLSFVGFKVVFYRRKNENQLLGYDATNTGGLDQYFIKQHSDCQRNEAFRKHQGKRLTFSVVNGNFIDILFVIVHYSYFFVLFLGLSASKLTGAVMVGPTIMKANPVQFAHIQT